MSEINTIPGIPIAFTNRVRVDWAGEHRFDAGRSGGPSIRLDGSGAEGPSPVDALLIALAACTGVDVVEILAKRRTPVASMHIDVEAPRAEAVPKRVIGVRLTYHIAGDGIERPHAERAIDLSVNKYCSVRDSIDPEMPVMWRLVLDSQPA